MKRMTAILLSIVFACLCTAPGCAVFDQKAFYDMGMAALKELKAARISDAVLDFEEAGNYREANYYKQYAQSMREIFQLDEGGEPDLEMTAYRLESLAGRESFSESLKENGLPSCEGLIIYIGARQHEDDGDHAAAWHLYASIEDVLDALDRKFALTRDAYGQGKAAYEAGEYQAAADALDGLNWRDSEDLYRKAIAILAPTPTPEPTAEPTQTPAPLPEGMNIGEGEYAQITPSPSPTKRPTVQPTAKPTDQSTLEPWPTFVDTMPKLYLYSYRYKKYYITIYNGVKSYSNPDHIVTSGRLYTNDNPLSSVDPGPSDYEGYVYEEYGPYTFDMRNSDNNIVPVYYFRRITN